jgi:hypothetical protein
MMTSKRTAVKWVFLIGVLSVVTAAHAQNSPARIEVPGGPMPIWVLAQSPADTSTDLQVICLFRSSPVNMLDIARVKFAAGRRSPPRLKDQQSIKSRCDALLEMYFL